MISRKYKSTVGELIQPVNLALHRLRVSADHLTLAGLVFGALAAVAFAEGRLPLGGLFLVLAGAADMLDGSLARASGSATPFGSFIDSVADRATDVIILGGLAWHYRERPELVAVLEGLYRHCQNFPVSRMYPGLPEYIDPRGFVASCNSTNFFIVRNGGLSRLRRLSGLNRSGGLLVLLMSFLGFLSFLGRFDRLVRDDFDVVLRRHARRRRRLGRLRSGLPAKPRGAADISVSARALLVESAQSRGRDQACARLGAASVVGPSSPFAIAQRDDL